MAIHLRTVAKQTWISVLRISLMLLIVVAMVCTMLLATEGGRIALLRQGVHALNIWSGMNIQLSGVRSPALASWRVERVRFTGLKKLEVIELTDLDVIWKWQYAFQNRWWIERIHLDKAAFTFTPNDTAPARGQGFARLYQLWPQIPSLKIDTLQVDQLELNRPNYDSFESAVDAQFEVNWGALPARFLIGLNDEKSGNQYASQLSADAIDFFRMKGHLLANPDSVWAQWMKWTMPEPAEANWDIRIDYSQQDYLTLHIDDWAMPWQSHMLTAKGMAEYNVKDVEVSFRPLEISLDDRKASLDGWINENESELKISIDQWTLAPLAQIVGIDDVTGRLSVDANWVGGWRRPRLDASIDGQGRWREYPFDLRLNSRAEDTNIQLTDSIIQLANNKMAVAGSVDWITDEFDLAYNGNFATDPLLRPLIPKSLSDVALAGEVSGTIIGPVVSPHVSTDANVEGTWRDDSLKAQFTSQWRDGQFKLSDFNFYSKILQAKGGFDYTLDNHKWLSDIEISEARTDILERLGIHFPVDFKGSSYGHVQVEGEGTAFELSGLINAQGLWQQWPMNAEINVKSLTAQKIELDASRINLGTSEALVSGGIDWSSHELNLSLNHKDLPLDMLPPWFKSWPNLLSSLSGQLTGNTKVYGDWSRPAIQTDSQFIGQWFNEPLSLSLAIAPETNLQWNIKQLDAQWLAGRWQYQGEFEPYQLGINGDVKFENIHGSYVPLLSKEFTGTEKQLPEEMDVYFAGQMAIKEKLTSPELNGKIRVIGTLDNQSMNIEANIGRLDTNHIFIDSAQGKWANGQWSIDGFYDWKLQQTALNIAAKTPNVSYIIPWVRLAMKDQQRFDWLDQWKGSLDGSVYLDNRTDGWLINGDLLSEGSLLNKGYQLKWQGSGRINQDLSHNISATWGEGKAQARLTSSGSTIDGNIDITNLRYRQLGLFLPVFPDDMTGSLSADILLSGETLAPDIQASVETQGQYSGHEYSSTLKIYSTNNEWKIEQTDIESPGALILSIQGAGTGRKGEIDISGSIPDLNYWVKREGLGSGEATFELQANGDLLMPELNGNFVWTAQQWPLSLRSTLVTTPENYVLDVGVYAEQKTRMKVKLSTPIAKLSSLVTQVNTTSFKADLVLNTPLSVLDPFFVDQPDQQISGDIQGELHMLGTLKAPRWEGELNWLNGQYEHANFGSLVDDILLTINAGDQQWHFQGTATDGDKGKISTSGFIDFFDGENEAFNHQINMTIGLSDAKLLNQAQLDAAITGSMQVTGSYHDILVAGQLKVSPLNMQSDRFLWDGAPQLNIVQLNGEATISPDQLPSYWPRGNWDLTLVADNRANLYGQGINAELSGALEVTDELYQPQLSGRFEIVRGTYVGFGKVFTLTEGSVQLQNEQIVLDIIGEYSDNDIDVTLRITGNQDALNLALTSDSAEGQDELLAQLLFGKNVEEMSVFQAIQLANVVNKLRTGDSGLDIIGEAREDLTLDSLIIDTNTDEEGNLTFNVSAGKYINDFLYLEVEQGVGADQDFRSSIQYQVAPRTYLELYTQGSFGQFDQNGIELNWSWDY